MVVIRLPGEYWQNADIAPFSERSSLLATVPWL
jgi:hypothetical protein